MQKGSFLGKANNLCLPDGPISVTVSLFTEFFINKIKNLIAEFPQPRIINKKISNKETILYVNYFSILFKIIKHSVIPHYVLKPCVKTSFFDSNNSIIFGNKFQSAYIECKYGNRINKNIQRFSICKWLYIISITWCECTHHLIMMRLLHNLLINRLSSIGLSAPLLLWFTSYITYIAYVECIDDFRSDSISLTHE